jgi:hypothetical protein
LLIILIINCLRKSLGSSPLFRNLIFKKLALLLKS